MAAHSTGILEGREVVKCDSCQLVQFKTASGNCRKCGAAYETPVAAKPVEPETVTISHPSKPVGQIVDVAAAVKTLRHIFHKSQAQLARNIGCPRTYISKIENYKAQPVVRSVTKFAEAFHISERDFVALATIGSDAECA